MCVGEKASLIALHRYSINFTQFIISVESLSILYILSLLITIYTYIYKYNLTNIPYNLDLSHLLEHYSQRAGFYPHLVICEFKFFFLSLIRNT